MAKPQPGAAFMPNALCAAVKDDVPGAKAIAEDLQNRFPGRRRRTGGSQTGTTETETVAETIEKQVSETHRGSAID